MTEDPVAIALPFAGRWRVENSPARRVPSHAPVAGTVVGVHDGEPDHEARRSQPMLLAYALTQASRAREGWPALAGNHVIIARPDGICVALAHLRAGSVRVSPGHPVDAGDRVGGCGNSGNSTQPHVHVQAMDGPDPVTARAVPLEFRDFREWPRGARRPRTRDRGVPGERAIVEPR